mmetsp:Transcript_1021/g.2559  ORF Transcript_1021/g.2559 Transcript_1021/m.2559 type:complete len:221 (+) Transcript_1021:301-963(+)
MGRDRSGSLRRGDENQRLRAAPCHPKNCPGNDRASGGRQSGVVFCRRRRHHRRHAPLHPRDGSHRVPPGEALHGRFCPPEGCPAPLVAVPGEGPGPEGGPRRTVRHRRGGREARGRRSRPAGPRRHRGDLLGGREPARDGLEFRDGGEAGGGKLVAGSGASRTRTARRGDTARRTNQTTTHGFCGGFRSRHGKGDRSLCARRTATPPRHRPLCFFKKAIL